MFTWLLNILLKPLLKPINKTIGLCDKLSLSMEKLVETVNLLPLEQVFKDKLLNPIKETKTAIYVIRSVLSKILAAAGEDEVTETAGSISKDIEEIKKAIK